MIALRGKPERVGPSKGVGDVGRRIGCRFEPEGIWREKAAGYGVVDPEVVVVELGFVVEVLPGKPEGGVGGRVGTPCREAP